MTHTCSFPLSHGRISLGDLVRGELFMTQEERRKMWASRLAEYRSSDQSVSQWCQQHGVKEQQMWYWLKKERGAKAPTEWLPVDLGEEVGSVTLRIAHVNIEVGRGFDQELLLSVIRALSALC